MSDPTTIYFERRKEKQGISSTRKKVTEEKISVVTETGNNVNHKLRWIIFSSVFLYTVMLTGSYYLNNFASEYATSRNFRLGISVSELR